VRWPRGCGHAKARPGIGHARGATDQAADRAGAAFGAAYALVLHAVLAAFLIAAIPVPAYASDFEICHAAAATGEGLADDVNGTAKRAAVHCKLCVSHAAGAALPPAQPELFTRLPISAPRQTIFALRLQQFARFTHASPRGPPERI